MDMQMEASVLHSLTLGAVMLRFFLAFLFGGVIGLERRWRQQVAGLRTHLLVCLGSCSTMIVSEYATTYYGSMGDPLRISAQVLSGIGFLGAGTIIMTSRHQIKGLTTAASLWTTACLGLALGIGFYWCAVVLFVLMMVVLLVMSRFDEKYLRIPADTSIYIEVRRRVGYGVIIQHVKARGWNIRDIREMHAVGEEVVAAKFDLTSGDEHLRAPLELDLLLEIDGIFCAEELYNEI